MDYQTYLNLEPILTAQAPISASPHEFLFIVTHQVQELWFRATLSELDRAAEGLDAWDLETAAGALDRAASLLQQSSDSLGSLDTLSADQFLSFRDALGSASGFQSAQFRHIEVRMGLATREALRAFPVEQVRLELLREASRPTVWRTFLARLGVPDSAPPEVAVERLHGACRQSAQIRAVCDAFAALDDAMLAWRHGHVRLVERIIGSRRGTGGSSGSTYLRETLAARAFPEVPRGLRHVAS